MASEQQKRNSPSKNHDLVAAYILTYFNKKTANSSDLGNFLKQTSTVITTLKKKKLTDAEIELKKLLQFLIDIYNLCQSKKTFDNANFPKLVSAIDTAVTTTMNALNLAANAVNQRNASNDEHSSFEQIHSLLKAAHSQVQNTLREAAVLDEISQKGTRFSLSALLKAFKAIFVGGPSPSQAPKISFFKRCQAVSRLSASYGSLYGNKKALDEALEARKKVIAQEEATKKNVEKFKKLKDLYDQIFLEMSEEEANLNLKVYAFQNMTHPEYLLVKGLFPQTLSSMQDDPAFKSLAAKILCDKSNFQKCQLNFPETKAIQVILDQSGLKPLAEKIAKAKAEMADSKMAGYCIFSKFTMLDLLKLYKYLKELLRGKTHDGQNKTNQPIKNVEFSLDAANKEKTHDEQKKLQQTIKNLITCGGEHYKKVEFSLDTANIAKAVLKKQGCKTLCGYIDECINSSHTRPAHSAEQQKSPTGLGCK